MSTRDDGRRGRLAEEGPLKPTLVVFPAVLVVAGVLGAAPARADASAEGATSAASAVATVNPGGPDAPASQASAPAGAANAEPAGHSGHGGTALLLVLGAVLMNAVICVRLHVAGRLTIFADYTDATLTLVAFLVPLAAFTAAVFADLTPVATLAATCACAATAGFVLVRSAYVHNSSVLFAIMSLVAKITVLGLFVLAMLSTYRSVARGRHESERRYERRRRREEAQQAVSRAALAGVLLVTTAAMTRRHGFEPLRHYVSLSFARARASDDGNETEPIARAS